MVLTARRAPRPGDVLRVARRARRRAHRSVLRVGSRVQCPVCGWAGARFMASSRPRRPNRICPGCGSSERDRALELWLRAQPPPPPGARLLEVAPIATLRPTAEALGYRYASVDLSSPRALLRGDLCSLPFPDGAFDLAVCFHVLEHVADDGAAAAELARVVGADGRAVVVVPWDPTRATTDEDLDTTPEERLHRFGQSDHVRLYGTDAPERWRGPRTAVALERWDESFSPGERARHALDGDDDRFWLLSAGAG